jgi:3-methylcrotonyl-CoA carboxylase alpha subunit
MIRSLLIANRGEIACRIIRTCRRLEIRAIAVYSDADRKARHVAEADEAIHIGSAPAAESYLDAGRIMAAAKASGAEAIHPGYGFLSEKPELPERCADAGIVFVGASADRIRVMGSKIGAKAIAAKAGIATVPGYAGDDQSPERLAAEAERIGFPLMIKASAGGGGKGMRRVVTRREFGPALDLARREAEAAFGDSSMLLEKLLLRPRHLEVQVAGDKHGAVVHLFERDCSIQRNHQKLIEEAPAPNLPDDVRAALLADGVALARAIAYDNLGTVEFIYEDGQAAPWFIEMNTRLQVEHPVTEAITGLDLVEWQIRIASGQPVPLQQDEIVAAGSAIEARITAERVDRGFTPAAGRMVLFEEPRAVRFDSGVTSGSEIGTEYDSLLAKAISHAPMREGAAAKLASALRGLVALGPPTTAPFLADVLDTPAFLGGTPTTAFIAEAFPGGWTPKQSKAGLARAIAAAIGAAEARSPLRFGEAVSPWSALEGFRVLGPAGGAAAVKISVSDDSSEEEIRLKVLGGGRYEAVTAASTLRFALEREGDAFVVSDGTVRRSGRWAALNGRTHLWIADETYAFAVALDVDRASTEMRKGSRDGAVTIETPGVVAEVRVAHGDMVDEGQTIAIVESMKLFIPIVAPVAGRVQDVRFAAGQRVTTGDLLVTIAPEEAGAKRDGAAASTRQRRKKKRS